MPDIGHEASPTVMSCCRLCSFGELSPRDDASRDMAMADVPAVGPAPLEVTASGHRPPPPSELEAGAGLSSKNCVHAWRAASSLSGSVARLACSPFGSYFVCTAVHACMRGVCSHGHCAGEREGH